MSWGRWNHSCSLASCPTPTWRTEKQESNNISYCEIIGAQLLNFGTLTVPQTSTVLLILPLACMCSFAHHVRVLCLFIRAPPTLSLSFSPSLSFFQGGQLCLRAAAADTTPVAPKSSLNHSLYSFNAWQFNYHYLLPLLPFPCCQLNTKPPLNLFHGVVLAREIGFPNRLINNHLSPLPGRNQAPQSTPSSVCPDWQPSQPPAGQMSGGRKWVCGQQPAAGRSLARCGHRSGLCPVPACQHANPSESPKRNSTLGERERRGMRGKEEERRSAKVGERVAGLHPGAWTN